MRCSGTLGNRRKHEGVFIVWLFLWMVLAGLLISGAGFESTDMTYHLNVVSHWGIVSESQTFGLFEYARAPVLYFNSLFHIISYSPQIFNAKFEIIRWLFLGPVLAGFSFGLIILFFSLFRRDV
jgi:hypothetical protein